MSIDTTFVMLQHPSAALLYDKLVLVYNPRGKREVILHQNKFLSNPRKVGANESNSPDHSQQRERHIIQQLFLKKKKKIHFFGGVDVE